MRHRCSSSKPHQKMATKSTSTVLGIHGDTPNMVVDPHKLSCSYKKISFWFVVTPFPFQIKMFQVT